MRMKFLRILPETCASTWCLFSSSTLNIALGSGSRTTAITSIASSLLIRSWLLRQNYRPIFRDSDAVLEMRAKAAVYRHRRPLVFEHSGLRLAKVDHGLDRDHHAFAQLGAVAAGPEIRNLRLFVQPR